MSNFWKEIQRRNVFKATIAYLVVAWVLLQVASILLDTFNSPDWIKQVFTIFLAVGLPVWIVISWIYDITPKGIEKTAEDSEKQIRREITSKRLNVFIITSLSIAVLVLSLKITNVFSSKFDKQLTIAVLPFEDLNMSNNIDDELFVDGIALDIHTSLSKIKGLVVISDKTIKRYKETNKTYHEIAKELGSDYLMRGVVRKNNDSVRITTQLIDDNDKQVWGNDYDKELSKFFKIQQEVAQDVAQKLKITLTPQNVEIIEKSSTENLEALKLFQKGRSLADGRTEEGLKRSIELYEQAVKLDSNYAEAIAETALSYYLLGAYGYVIYRGTKVKAENLVKKALKINPATFRAFTVRAKINMADSNWESAKTNFEKAFELNPNDATAHHHYSEYFMNKPIPDYENSLIQINLALQLDPLSMPVNKEKFYLLIRSNRIDEAENFLNKTNFLFDESNKTWFECLILVHKNKDWTEAIRFYEKALNKEPKNTDFMEKLSLLYNYILNDKKKAVEYARMAYNMDPAPYSTILLGWVLSLNKEFEEVETLLNKSNFGNEAKNMFLLDKMYIMDQPEKALEYYYRLKNKNPRLEILILSKIGDKKKVNKLLMDYQLTDFENAEVYANLGEKDSMYYYLNKTSNKFLAIETRYNTEFDPYLKEARYIAFLKKNYLPLTHRNK